MTVMTADAPCAECDQPAARTLGTTPLCHHCHNRVIESILERRPDLRAPELGYGRPEGPPDRLHGPPLLRCHRCDATWHGDPWMDCPWCEQRNELDQQIQRSIDEGRMRDYLTDIAEGSLTALQAAAGLLAVAVPRGTLRGHWAALMAREWEKAAA